MSRDQLREIGVLIGFGGGSQDFTDEQFRLYYSGRENQCSVYAIPISTIGTLVNEVSMRFGFRGPSHLISTGCASSTDAIGRAFTTFNGAFCLDVERIEIGQRTVFRFAAHRRFNTATMSRNGDGGVKFRKIFRKRCQDL